MNRAARMDRQRLEWLCLCALFGAGWLLGADFLAHIRNDLAQVHGAWHRIALVYYSSCSVAAGLAIVVLAAVQRHRRGCGDAVREAELRSAMAQGQFSLHYQPIVDASGRQRGVEALLRWTHPRRGPVAPDEFIALAERTGLIIALGQWVVEQACQQLARFSTRPSTAHLTVAINVSASQFQQPDFVHMVLSALRRAGAPADRLKLELTETMSLQDVDGVGAKMRALRACGVACALDDFGTGYASLSYLRKLPLSVLKIDRSFVRDVPHDANDAAIVRALVTLARGLGLDVVAEGVETRAQFEFLKASGCMFFQGYLFGKPAPLGIDDATPAASGTVVRERVGRD